MACTYPWIKILPCLILTLTHRSKYCCSFTCNNSQCKGGFTYWCYNWYIKKMRNDFLIAKKKKNRVFTTEIMKLFKKRWKACEKVHLQDSTSRTALRIGNTIPVVTVKDEEDNTYYKVILNTLHEHRLHKGSCNCMMWQEHLFPCKHSMFVIKHRCGGNEIASQKYIVKK